MISARTFSVFLTFVLCTSLHPAELGDLERRIDQMLDRLNQVGSRNSSLPPTRQIQDQIPLQTEELPEINLPASSEVEVTAQNNETTDSFDHLESRVDQMIQRLDKLDAKTSPESLPQDVESPVPAPSHDQLPQIILPPTKETKVYSRGSEVSESFDRLESRINKLLNRLDLPVNETSSKVTTEPRISSIAALPVIDLDRSHHDTSSSFALPEDDKLQDFEPPALPKNRFSFYLGFSIPNDSTYTNSSGNHDIKFGNGYELGLEYNRFFEDESYIGTFIEGKFFDTDSLAGNSTNGDNRLINFGFTLGQDWTLSEHLALKTQASIGASSAHYEITSENYSSTDLAFHYSFLLGLEVKWNEYWHTNFYYELDGRSSADRMDYQSFHQVGVETGVGF
jgi:hypothetical protein